MKITETQIRQVIKEEIKKVLSENFAGAKNTIGSISAVIQGLTLTGENPELVKALKQAAGTDSHAKVTLEPWDVGYQKFNVYLGDNTNTSPINSGMGPVSKEALNKGNLRVAGQPERGQEELGKQGINRSQTYS